MTGTPPKISMIVSYEMISAWTVLAYFLARYPLACAWKAIMITVIFRSLSSSSWASTPVRKKILLCPILYKLGSRSRCLI